MIIRVAGSLVVAAWCGTSWASVIYNHSITSTNVVAAPNDYQTSPPETSSDMEVPGGMENVSQVGQRLTFAGTDRFVTRVDMGLVAFFFPCTTDMTAYIYADQAGLPGTLLWSGTVTGVELTPSLSNTVVPVSFTPNITVPDSVFLAISHSNIIAQRSTMGTAMMFTAAGIGTPGSWVIKNTTTGLWTSGPTSFDLSTRITAIPAPGACPLLAVGFLALTRRRR